MSDIPEMTAEEEALWRKSDDEVENEAYDPNSTFDDEPEEDLEQPSTDTDEEPTDDVDNSEAEEDTDSDDEPETEDEPEEDLEEPTKEVDNSDDEETTEEETKESNTESEQLRPVKANGVEIPVKSIDEVYQMASMGADYKRKMADIAPFRRSISAMKENGVSEADINTFIDMKKGNKEALQSFIKGLGVDPLDIDTDADSKYVPTQHGTDEVQSEITEIVNQISADPEYATTQKVVDSDWDSESRKVLAENPAMIRGLHEEIKKGVYAKVAPEALRMEILDNGKRSKLDYYLAAEKLYYEAENNKQSKVNETKSAQKTATTQRKRAAAPTRGKATSSKSAEPDFVNMSDDEYEEFYNKVMRN